MMTRKLLLPVLVLVAVPPTLGLVPMNTHCRAPKKAARQRVAPRPAVSSDIQEESAEALQKSLASTTKRIPVGEVMRCLRREYASFFDPLEPKFYVPSVTFDDPLSSLSGLDAYRNNVDMLAGRTPLGRFLFKDASIALHDVRETGPLAVRTRWTLRVTFSALPWRPVARFTGVSDYALDETTGRVAAQTDYWDSIDLRPGGLYERSSKVAGINDFAAQLFDDKARDTDNELPYELLRRAESYSVRRYPATRRVSVFYDARPEAYSLLGAYAAGENAARRKLAPFAPSVVSVPRDESKPKEMWWPVSIVDDDDDDKKGGEKDSASLPEPSTTALKTSTADQLVVAVLRFDGAATRPAAEFYTKELEAALDADGLRRADGADDALRVAQFDAIFQVGARRNEIWIPIEVPDYWA